MATATIHIGAATGQVGPARSSEGPLGELDTAELDVLVPCASFPGWRTAAAGAGYTRDAAMPGWSGMYVRALPSAEEEGGAHALVSVSAHGLLTPGEKRKRTISCAGQVISVGPLEKVVLVWSDEEKAEDAETGDAVEGKRRIPKVDEDGEVEYKSITTPTGVAERWNINQAILNVTDVYFATAAPATNVGGTAQTPPSAPTPPPYIWGSYGEPMRLNHPAGWVLDNREIEELVPGQLWRVTDTYAYYYAGQPD